MASKPQSLSERMVGIFGAGGRLSKVMKNPEVRAGQLEMARAVADTLENGRYLAVEAGTGTGKSLGCLVPAALYAVETKKRVVYATHTITLQQQLTDKDVPILKQLLGDDTKVKVALIKGRRNYVCKRKVIEAKRQWYRLTFKTPAAAAVFRRVIDHILETDAGERDQIPYQLSPEVWEPIQSESDTCLAKECPYFHSCHYFRAQRRAQKAHVVVANQALVFTDLVLKARKEEGVLPDYDVLILDEAHHMEDVATSSWQVSISKGAIETAARSLEHLARAIGAKKRGMDQVQAMAVEWRRAGERFLATLPEPGLIKTPCGDASALDEMAGFVRERLELLFALNPPTDSVKAAAQGAQRRLAELVQNARMWTAQSKPDYAYWVTQDRYGALSAEMAPVDVSRTLKEHLFHDGGPKVIAVSATLSEKLLQRCGFPEPTIRRVQSPFNLREQVRLYCPVRCMSPTEQNLQQYEAYLKEQIQSLCEISQGRALILFTATDMMNRVYEATADWFAAKGWKALRQGGDVPRAKLIQEFREDIHSCLFGLMSLWEGVDVPGEACSLVIICRLPFGVPTDPLSMARAELIRQRGGEPFLEMALPNAVVKFRQGFGRLIRTAQDRGVVAVLDGRIRGQGWPKEFRDAVADVEGTGSLEKVGKVLYGDSYSLTRTAV